MNNSMNIIKIEKKKKPNKLLINFKRLVIAVDTIIGIAIICSILGVDFDLDFDFDFKFSYEADAGALNIVSPNNISQNNIYIEDNFTILKGTSNTGIIFYPGAKVESESYLPILQKLQNKGYTCVLVDMPFDMAIFNFNGADDVFNMDIVSNVENWYISGHSMGGGMASYYASKNPELVDGLILMGAYVYGDYSPKDAITIYGSYNSNLEDKIDYTENIVKIEGGNHAKFGNYGSQKGDPDGDITTEEQQNITVDAIVSFISNRSNI